MVIEVTGVNTWNKGAELMLVAIREHFAHCSSEVSLAVDGWFGGYSDRARHGLLLMDGARGTWRSRIATSLMPTWYRRILGVATQGEVEAVLDASGFAFGDQHPTNRVVRFAEFAESVRRRGCPLILLPQALGPFEKMKTRAAFARVVDAADLVYARDEVSLENARRAAGDRAHIRLAPDFTNLVATTRERASDDHRRVCIVPNERMIEKAESQEAAAAYVPLLAECVRAVERAEFDPVVLLHGRDDSRLLARLSAAVGSELSVIREADPVSIKQILGNCAFVIASRFHALVSSLSQGVPCIATSWSHKYEMLFRDYGCEDLILPVPATEEQIVRCIQLVAGPTRSELVKMIEERGQRIKVQAREMWKEVDGVLGLGNENPSMAEH